HHTAPCLYCVGGSGYLLFHVERRTWIVEFQLIMGLGAGTARTPAKGRSIRTLVVQLNQWSRYSRFVSMLFDLFPRDWFIECFASGITRNVTGMDFAPTAAPTTRHHVQLL